MIYQQCQIFKSHQKKGNEGDNDTSEHIQLFSVDSPIIDNYSGTNLVHHLNIIDQEPLSMNQVKSQHELIKLCSINSLFYFNIPSV